MMIKRLLLLSLCFSAGPAFATTYYINDELEVTLRKGQGNQYQILKVLKSGTPLEVLNVEGEFAYARTANGTEGWVRMQYLTPEPIARDKLAAAEGRLAQLETEKKQLLERAAALRAEKAELEKARRQLESDNTQMQAELDRLRTVAAKPIEMETENRSLKSKVAQMEEEMRLLEQQTVTLRDRAYRDWFLAGAGVLLFGLLLGLVLPKMRKRSSWGGELR